MDTTVLFTSFLLGLVGFGMFLYGKKAGRIVPLAAGVILMIIPYVVTNLIALVIVSCVLMGSPWIIREA
jgi:hypothetical protein